MNHREIASSLNGRVWALIEKTDRSADEIDEMIHAAHASLWHWLQVGGAVHRQRGEWLVGRAYVVAGDALQGRRYAQRAFDRLSQGGFEDFDHAYGHELLARVHALSGNAEEAAKHHEEATRLGLSISDGGDRNLFAKDIARGPWFGMTFDAPTAIANTATKSGGAR